MCWLKLVSGVIQGSPDEDNSLRMLEWLVQTCFILSLRKFSAVEATIKCPQNTYWYFGEYIQDKGQHRQVDLNPLSSKSFPQVFWHSDHSCSNVNWHKNPAKDQQCPSSLARKKEKIHALYWFCTVNTFSSIRNTNTVNVNHQHLNWRRR